MVRAFNHIGINVRDLQKTLSFYTHYLGAQFRRGLYLPSSHTIGAYVQIGDMLLEFLSPLSPDETAEYGIAHIAYITDNIQETQKELSSSGYSFYVESKKAGSGAGKIAFFKDPNGASIELIERSESYWEPDWVPSTEILDFDHASVCADLLGEGLHCYQDDLGMQPLHHYHFEDRQFDMIYLNMGRNILELLHNAEPHQGPLMGHFALRVADVHAFARKMENEGIEVVSQPKPLATQNGYACSIKDPDGITVELIDRPSLFEV